MELFVGNLQFGLDSTDLKESFGRYGRVDDAKVIFDKQTGKSRGFGFVTMPDADEAALAMKWLDGSELAGRTIHVNESEARTVVRPQYGRRRG